MPLPIKRRVLPRVIFPIPRDEAPEGEPGHRHTYPAFRFLSYALGFTYPPFRLIFSSKSFASRLGDRRFPSINGLTSDVSYVVQGIPYSYPDSI